MLSDLLPSIAPGGVILVNEEDYLLARVELGGREMLAEISTGSRGGIRPGDWPRIEGVLVPDSTICRETRTDTLILLFSIPEGGRLLLERLAAGGPMTEPDAAALGLGVLGILRRLHQDGVRVGYLGPETIVLTAGGRPMILGGARGVPDSPFSPPESVGRIPDDPRSDVFALGLLMFRAIAGSDSRERQIEAWNALSEPFARLLERMVAPDPEDRFAHLAALTMEFEQLHSTPPGDGGPAWRTPRRRSRSRFRWAWLPPVILAAAALVYLLLLRPRPDGEPEGGPDDGAPAGIEDSLPTPADTAAAVFDTVPGPAAEPVVWVSNGTGQTGAATAFREGPAAGISGVYTCTASRRGRSLLLVRRDDPSVPPASRDRFAPFVAQLAGQDSTMQVSPVDITLLLGADLRSEGALPGPLPPASEPAGTLYVDIANHGVTADFGGSGAASWTRSVLHGGRVDLGGLPWIVQVVDVRDGDQYNPELGIPTLLDSTLLLYRSGSPTLDEAGRAIRQALLRDSTGAGGPGWLPDPPDIWILLGS